MKRAWVLSGGGAKGAFQVGVMKHLFARGKTPDVIYGTSVGALNAAGLSHAGLDKLLEKWLSIKGSSDVLKPNYFSFLFKDGFYSLKPLEKTLNKIMASPARYPVRACYIDLDSGAVKYGSEPYEVLASGAIPAIMETVSGHLCDGGVREQAPLYKAFEEGATEIIAVLCNPVLKNPFNKWENNKFPKMLHTMLRAIDIMEHEVFLNDLEYCQENKIPVTVIAPDYPMMDTLDFSPEKIKAAILLGEEKAKKVFP